MMLLVDTSMSMSRIMAYENIPQNITDLMLSIVVTNLSICSVI
ncbi:MAG: hypothetical protein R3B47_10255 [Bacteroidia bacterium]